MKYFYLFIVLLTISFSSCKEDTTKIACVGDSITEGFGHKEQCKTSYPFLLKNILGFNYDVLNFGRSATTMNKKGDFPYWITKEISNVFASNPDIILIMLGTNDTKPKNWNPQTFENSYQTMIDTFNTISSKPQIILCKPIPVMETKWGINDSTIVVGVIPTIEKLAKKNNLNTIDLYTPLKKHKEIFIDDVHPDENGTQIIAEILAKNLIKTE